MKKINITAVTDGVFALISAFILSLCVLRYFKLNYAAAIALSIIIALSLAAPIFFALNYARSKRLLRRSEKSEKDKLMLHLALTDEKEILYILCSMRDEAYNICDFYAFNKSEVLLPVFSVEPLDADAIAEKTKRFLGKDYAVTLYCNALSPAAAKLCVDLKFNVVNGDATYLEMKQLNLLPEKYMCDAPKKTLKDKLLAFSAKANGKSFIWGGIGLLIFSLFTLFPLYYIISGGALTLLGLIIRFLPKPDKS